MLSIIQAAGWPIWPLIASSVLALAIVLERLISLTDHKIAPADLLAKVLAATSQRIPESTAVIELEKSSALGCVLASAFHLLQAHPKASDEDLRETMQTTGAVFAFVVVMALFLYLTDKTLEWALYDLVLGWKKS